MIDYDSIEIVTQENHSLFMRLRNPSMDAGYIVKNIEGLDAPDFNLITRESLYGRTSLMSNRVAKREITLTVLLNTFKGTAGVAEAREKFYKLVGYSENDFVRFRLLKNSNEVAFIECYVKSIQQNPFTKDPELQIVFSCRDSYIRGNFISVIPTMQLGNFTINYNGTAPTYIHAAGSNTGTYWLLHNQTSNEIITVERTVPGRWDYNSSPNNRYITAGAKNMIGNLRDTDRYNYWIQLRPGINRFRTLNVTAMSILEYYEQHLGV